MFQTTSSEAESKEQPENDEGEKKGLTATTAHEIGARLHTSAAQTITQLDKKLFGNNKRMPLSKDLHPD